MNQTALNTAVAAASGLSQSQAARAVTALFDVVVRTVTAGEPVSVTNFGTFRPAQRPAGTRQNPRTGERFTADAKTCMRFRVSPKTRRIVAAGDPNAVRRKGTGQRHADQRGLRAR
ncbi:HU family DNA-binding protein [Streptomyces monomycini]|uniref:HU family DNA-binding protein n=1 Tax=Streptomyces monomycini TaxID=371720 RepID=UPI001EEB0FF7|nr:HU family DNA-binding protein [Streptomyces monomycini]